MSKVVIVTKRERRFGAKMILPYDGEVTVSETGEVTVSGECAEHLTKNGIDWEYPENQTVPPVEKEKKVDDKGNEKDTQVEKEVETIEETPDESKPDTEIPDSNTPNGEDDKSEAIDLSKLTVSSLHQVAKEAGLPKKQWQGLRKAELIAYIERKIK